MSNPFPSRSRHALTASFVVSVALAACGGGAGRYAGVPADDLFTMAVTEFDQGNHGNAIEVLDRLLVSHGDWDRIPEARLKLGDVHFDNGDYLTARAEYTRFLDRYAGHPGSADAALGICKSLAAMAPKPQRDQGYTQQAMTSCRNVVIDFAGREQAAQAAIISNQLRLTLAEKEFMTGDFYFRRGLYDSAIKYYEFVIRLYPESEVAPQALLGIYLSNQKIGYQDLAEEARDRLLLEYPDSESAASIRTDGAGS
jgi:outer membrane protein assembly factor BamD